MSLCTTCQRDDVPRLPLSPIAGPMPILVAHVTTDGRPCLEGMAPETHASMLVDFPREALDDDEVWDLGDDAPIPNEYLNADGSLRQFRPPEEVFRPESMTKSKPKRRRS